MSYLVIDDFRLGMDRRKDRISGTPGALWEGVNGHITRGGDFERRKKFVERFVLPEGLTQGLTQVKKQLFVFGSGTTPVGMPAGVSYQQLAHPGVKASVYVTITGGTSNPGVNRVTSILINGVQVLGANVDWTTSHAATATAIAAQINSYNSTPEYTAVATGATVVIYAAEGTGTGPNGFLVGVTSGGDVTVSLPASSAMSGGVAGSSVTLTGVTDVTTFGGKIYAVAEYDDGSVFHYYDGARVTSWDTVAASLADNEAIASALYAKIDLDPRYVTSAVGDTITIIAAEAGTAFTITADTVDGGGIPDEDIVLTEVQANVAAVAETRAFCTIEVTGGVTGQGVNNGISSAFFGVWVNGANILDGVSQITWVNSNEDTADSLALSINRGSEEWGGFTASVSGRTVTLYAPVGVGATGNTYDLTIFSSYSLEFSVNGVNTISPFTPLETYDFINAFSGGVDAVAPVAQVYTAEITGTFQVEDRFTITIDGVDYKTTGMAAGMGATAITYQAKVYSVSQSILEFCALNDPTLWGSGTGSGFINMANQNAENETLVCIKQYQNRIAVFSRNSVQVWVLATDPANNTYQQTVENTGALSARSVLQYGNIDVFYLNDQGVRSLRARDSSNAPAVNDVGVAIDTFVQEYSSALSGAQIERACAVIEPEAGRYWLALHNRIFVYSFFPGSKISAWTYYDLEDDIGDIDIAEMVRAGNRMYIRAGDSIYLYGGDSRQVYPDAGEMNARMVIPYLSAGKPATVKGITGIDLGARGTWEVKLLPVCYDETTEVLVGRYTKPTFAPNDSGVVQHPVSLFGLVLECSEAGYASVTNMAVHFDIQGET